MVSVSPRLRKVWFQAWFYQRRPLRPWMCGFPLQSSNVKMENAPFIDNFPAINLDLWWIFLLKPPFSWNFMGTSKLIQLYMMEKIHYPFRLKEGSRERKHQTQTIWGWSVIVLCMLNSFICHSIINFMRSLSLCVFFCECTVDPSIRQLDYPRKNVNNKWYKWFHILHIHGCMQCIRSSCGKLSCRFKK